MSQTSKLLCWFLSTPPPLGGWGYSTKFYMGGGGGSAPRSPPRTLLYTALVGKVRPSGRSRIICAIIGITLRVSALPLVPGTFSARFPVSAFCRRFVGLQLTPSPLHALKIRQSPGYPKNVPNTVPRKMLKSAFETTSIMWKCCQTFYSVANSITGNFCSEAFIWVVTRLKDFIHRLQNLFSVTNTVPRKSIAQ